MKPLIRILFIGINPKGTSRLRLDEEIRSIDNALRISEHRDTFEIKQHWAVRSSDLKEILLRHKPHIVHFSGHGSNSDQLLLEDEQGYEQPVSTAALSKLFSTLKDNIRCVVLNACYSENQAKVICSQIEAVIGMRTEIGDHAAIKFSSSFYQALGYGRTIKEAFDLGCLQIELSNLPEADIPQLWTLSDPAKISFIAKDSSSSEKQSIKQELAKELRTVVQERFKEEADYYVPLSGEFLKEKTASRRTHRSQARMHKREKIEYYQLIQIGYLIQKVKVENLLEEFEKHSVILLLGEPGAGKSTALENLAYQLSKEPGKIPLPLKLSEFHPELSIKEFIIKSVEGITNTKHWSIQQISSTLFELLRMGALFVLFDGLNEMPSAGYKLHLNNLKQFIEEWKGKGNQFLITCRSLDYGQELSGFQRFEVSPFENHQIIRFLKMELPSEWSELWGIINKNEGLLKLSRNPYMLTVMVDIFIEDQIISQNRAELLKRFIQILLKWSRQRVDTDWINVDSQIEVLSKLAYEMQSRSGSGAVVKRELIESVLPQELSIDPDWPSMTISFDKILTFASNANILELSVDQTLIGFYHQILQEFFAANELIKLETEEVVKKAAWKWKKSELPVFIREKGNIEPLPPPPTTGWEETMIIAFALKQKNSGAFLQQLTEINPILAGRCILEAGVAVDSSYKTAVTTALVETTSSQKIAKRIRIEAGKILGKIGDPRIEQLIKIPAGEFYFQDEYQEEALNNTNSLFFIEDYWVSKFPVTNMEFGRFIAEGGYDRQEFWTEAGWLWRNKKFGKKPAEYEQRFWNWALGRNKFTEPEYFNDERWNRPNYPVVGITWYETVAYCRWLTKHWQATKKIKSTQKVSLPSEIQWEKAARGGIKVTDLETGEIRTNPKPKRKFPWGNNFHPERLNMNAGSETIMSTSPVGVFPDGASPYGCMDMCGNVWEWTSSKFWDLPYISNDGRESLEGRSFRVLKGISWFESEEIRAHCSYRGKGHPATFSGGLFGFRIVIE